MLGKLLGPANRDFAERKITKSRSNKPTSNIVPNVPRLVRGVQAFLCILLLALLSFPVPVFAATFTLESQDFKNAHALSKQFTCDGEGVSPALSWRHPPPGTKSLVLIMSDPDAMNGTWYHFVVFNLPPSTHGLARGIKHLPKPALFATNTGDKAGYTPLCPPYGIHRYHFELYALKTRLPLSAGASVHEVQDAMRNHILGRARLMGYYGR